MVIESSSSPSTTIVVTDASIKNEVATSISHTHTHNNPITKTVHHVVHITSTKAELFAIRYGINQASNQDSISKIIVITDSIHAAKKIFDLFLHPFQIHLVVILAELQQFFCCGNHLSQRQMITQVVNLLEWISNFTRELNKESLLN